MLRRHNDPKTADTSGFLAFIHIERAGGTSTHSYLQRHVPGYRLASPLGLFANEPDNVHVARETDGWMRALGGAGVGGHSVRSWPELWPSEPILMTVLRDPIERTVSHWLHQRDHTGIPWSLRDFVADGRHWDWQTVRLTGSRNLEAAKRELERFRIVGFTDTLDQLLIRFSEPTGCACRPPRVNAGAVGSQQVMSRLSPKDRQAVERSQQLDAALIQWARERWWPLRCEVEIDCSLDLRHRSALAVSVSGWLSKGLQLLAGTYQRRARFQNGFGERVASRSKELAALPRVGTGDA